MQASELIYYGRQFCDLDSTKQREKASEGAEQAVTIQYNTAWVPTIPQPKQFCYHVPDVDTSVDTRRTEQYRHSGDADNRHSPVGLELTEVFSLLGGVYCHSITFRRRLLVPVKRYKRGEISTAT